MLGLYELRFVRLPMKKIASMVLLLLCLSPGLSAEPYRSLNDRFAEVEANPADWKGKEVAFEGQVMQVEKSNGNPYFLIGLTGPESRELWVASLFNFGDDGAVQPGDIVRVFGYYTVLKDDDSFAQANSTGIHLLGFCVANLSQDTEYKFVPAAKQCTAWGLGDLPKVAGDEL